MKRLNGILLALCLLAEGAAADINIGTWNIQRLGHDNQKSFESIASVASRTDFLAIQEVMTDQAIEELEVAIERQTGGSWSNLQSHAVGRGSYKERYAFLWNDAKVSYVDGAVVYLDRYDTFEREPFSARFEERSTGVQFVAATVHILYGDGIEDRAPEIKALAGYWDWLNEVYDNNPNLFLMGDFNLPPNNPHWRPLLAKAKPLVTTGASTLSSVDSRFVNLYDNVFVSRSGGPVIKKAFVLNYPKLLGWGSHKKARKHVSDHAPIFVTASLSTSTIAAPSKPAVRNAEAIVVASVEAPIIGNRNSMIFHKPDCPSYTTVSRKNRVSFDSEEAATAAGYRIAGNCR